MNNIEAVWQSIISHGGETFYTITGIPFSYTARNGYIKLNNTNRNISMSSIRLLQNFMHWVCRDHPTYMELLQITG
jgi:hypothetical protein